MNTVSPNRIVRRRAWRSSGLGLLFCFFQAGNLLAVDPFALKIEEAQRAFQARYKMLTGQAATWPANMAGEIPPEYPPDGFYADDLADAATATALVQDLADKIKKADFGHRFTIAPDGDIEGYNAIPFLEPPTTFGNCGQPPPFNHTIPWPEDISVANYPTQFQKLAKVLCDARYVVLDSATGVNVVGPGGKGTLTQKRKGRSLGEWHNTRETGGTQHGGPLRASGTLSCSFAQTPGSGQINVYVLGNFPWWWLEPPSAGGWNWEIGGLTATNGDLCGQPNALPWSAQCPNVQVEGNTAKIDWALSQYSCPNDGGGCDGCSGCFDVVMDWELFYTDAQHQERASDEWNSSGWEDDGGSMHLEALTGGFASLVAIRGRIYVNLANYTGLARCYLRATGDPGAQNPPVLPDERWHLLESSQPGAEWLSSVLGDEKPQFGEESWAWDMDGSVIIVTPDFQYNIEGCDCPLCSGQNCRAGDVVGSLADGAPRITIGLGLTNYGESAGELVVGDRHPEAAVAQASHLEYHTSPDSEVIRTPNGVLRQVKTAQTLADIVTINDRRYEIHLYTDANAGAKSGGVYQPSTGSEYSTITVENPNGNIRQLQVTEVTSGAPKVSTLGWDNSGDTKIWTFSSGGGLRQEERTSRRDEQHQNRTEIYTVGNDDHHVTYKEQLTYRLFDWGEELVEKVVDPDGAALTTTWEYDDNGFDSYGYARLKKETAPSGHWTTYDQYDQFGNPLTVVSQFKDLPQNSGANPNRVTITTYGTDDPPTVTVVERIAGHEVSRRYTVSHPGETREIQAQTPGAAWNDPANLVTVTRTYVGGPFEGKVQDVTRPDGTMSIYQYEYVSSGAVSNLITIVSTGEPNGDHTAIVNGTKSTNVVSEVGQTLLSATVPIVDGTTQEDLLLSWSATVETDDFGRPAMVVSLNGTNTTDYGCCGVRSTTDEEGLTTQYTYDGLKRVTTIERDGIVISNTYDAVGHLIGTFRNGVMMSLNTYDFAGRLLTATDALTYTTSYAETRNGDGEPVKTITYPNDVSRTETYYQDGQLKSLTGSAVHGVQYDHGVDDNGLFAEETLLKVDDTPSGEWTRTSVDMVGRAWKTAQGGGVTSSSSYNAKGQLTEQVDADGVTTLYTYNGKGELEVTAVDMDHSGSIGADDRITSNVTDAVRNDLGVVRRTQTYVYGETGPILSAVSEITNDGLISRTSAYGLTNRSVTVYDRARARRTVTTTAPDHSTTEGVFENGRLMSLTRQDTGQTTYIYDDYGRPSRSTDGRGITTAYDYAAADRLAVVTNAVGTANQQVTRYFYDSVGRRVETRLPDNASALAAYWPTGEIATNWGARTYPVAYAYDHAGRMIAMTTWKDYAGNTGTATTTWNYDHQRGWLSSKLYDDRTGPTYTYTDAGRLKTRTWARSSALGGQITTTYDYNNAGDLVTIMYSDDTPDVRYTYDRRGRRISVTQGVNTTTLTYNDAGQSLTESFPGSGMVVSNTFDPLLRRSSSSVLSPPSPIGSQLLAIGYQYDAVSRLRAISNGTHSVTYTYLPNSSLVSNIVFRTAGLTRMTTTKNWDNRNRLQQIQTVNAELGTLNSFAYTYNAANQRTRVDLPDGSWWIDQYDPLGQVTSARKYWSDGAEVAGQQSGYSFDDIGNRELGTVNEQASTYSANNLNQYTQRTVPGHVWELGSAASDATVTINNQRVSRRSGFQPRPEMAEYFWNDLPVANTTGPVYTQLTTVAVLKNDGTNRMDIVASAIGKVFIAQSPELFGYDSDGNLISEGRWTYTWDAENRLVAMETSTNAVAAVGDSGRRRLEFNYDYLSRRIHKKVYVWETNHWLLATDLRFVYDGWNLVAELSASNFPLSLVRSYTWGLDLSGTDQGAGGVGGLLAVTSHQSPVTSHFVAYDGNGNVSTLLDADSGQPTATYEYGPFGEPLRQTYANPLVRQSLGDGEFRFSTKYTDAETGLLYYGCRYYQPSTGRWISRDVLEEEGGEHLYGYVRNNALNYVDPEGLNLYAIDGTGNDETAQSNVRSFVSRYSVVNGPAVYYRGVGNPADNMWSGQFFGGAFGAGSAGIVERVMKQICRDYQKDNHIKIDIVGFSRGAAIANEIATVLRKKGCVCTVSGSSQTASTVHPRVRFLGLFDAVYAFPRAVSWAWNDQTIPSNVQNAAHAFASDETRTLFRPTTLQPASSDTQLAEQWFPGRHSDIGGTIDMNRVIGTWTLRWMIDRAEAAGVMMDENGLPDLQQIEKYVRNHPKVTRPGPKTENATAWFND